MTIFFPDLSHYLPGVPLTGVPALITKATQGTGNIDATYASYRDKAHALGIPFAGYHYVTTDSPAEQARHAFSVIGRTVPAMWDVEAGSGNIAHLLAVHDAYVALGGRATLAYVPQWYWGQIGRPDLRPLAARGLALISSAYTTYSDSGIGWKPYGGITPDIWQYTSSGPLNGHKVDMNAFRGTVAELRKLFDGGTSAADVGVDMPLTDADAGTLLAHKLNNPVTNADAPVSDFLRTILREVHDLRANLVPALAADEDAETAALAAIRQAVAALPAAIAALPGSGAGGTLAEADIEQAIGAVFARTTLTVAPPPAAPGA